MDLETRERIGCWERGRRAKQFRATSSGREGMRFSAGGSGSDSSWDVQPGEGEGEGEWGEEQDMVGIGRRACARVLTAEESCGRNPREFFFFFNLLGERPLLYLKKYIFFYFFDF